MDRRCDTPSCGRLVPEEEAALQTPEDPSASMFCDRCRGRHSARVLLTQVEHQKPIKEIIVDSALFKNAGGMADYIGVSFVTLYHWIRKYFGCSFQEFKRVYICKAKECYTLDIRRSSYSRHDYVLKKLRQKRYCACVNTLESANIMTNAPLAVVQTILKGRPKIEKISDGAFAIVPDPVKIEEGPRPVYFDVHQQDVGSEKKGSKKKGKIMKNGKKPAKSKITKPRIRQPKTPLTPMETFCSQEQVPRFGDRLLFTLLKLGGTAEIKDLVPRLRTNENEVPRVNNTRREAHRNPNLLALTGSGKQSMKLLVSGTKAAQKIEESLKKTS